MQKCGEAAKLEKRNVSECKTEGGIVERPRAEAVGLLSAVSPAIYS